MQRIPVPMSGMRKAELEAIIEDIPSDFIPAGAIIPKTNRQRIDYINVCRAIEREALFAAARRPRKPASVCEISAADVNEWLRTLPPPQII